MNYCKLNLGAQEFFLKLNFFLIQQFLKSNSYCSNKSQDKQFRDTWFILRHIDHVPWGFTLYVSKASCIVKDLGEINRTNILMCFNPFQNLVGFKYVVAFSKMLWQHFVACFVAADAQMKLNNYPYFSIPILWCFLCSMNIKNQFYHSMGYFNITN